MTQKEYDKAKQECWEEYVNLLNHNSAARYVFDKIFDRTYALGKLQASCKQVEETITQEEIEKAAIEYVLTRQQARHNAKKEEDATMRDFDKTIKAWDAYDIEQAFESGANLFLGKQKMDAKPNNTIKARRKSDGEIIEVRRWRGASDVIYSSPDMNQFYQASDLDFNVDAEDSVIQGWVARDEDGRIYLYENKPERENGTPYCKPNEWVSGNVMTKLNVDSFPDLTWDDDPIEVEIIIKRKKK